MDLNSLRRLASGGLSGWPLAELETLADWCVDYAEATGDTRYHSVARALELFWMDWFDRPDHAMPRDLFDQINELITTQLPGILDAEDAQVASALARELREAIVRAIADA